MGRIRLVFALLAVLLLVPMAVLVQRALRSLDVEREVRHRAVAERVFDEMERELSRVLRREEDRPFEHYRFYATLEGDYAERSPLSTPPGESYLIGYFQIEPDGSFHSPLVPRDRAAAESRGDWPGAPGTDRRVAALERIVDRGLRVAATPRLDEVAGRREAFAQAPGTTLEVVKKERKGGEAAEEGFAPAEAEPRDQIDAYSALRALNRASRSRDQRQAKRQQAKVARPMEERVAGRSAPAPFVAFAEADAALLADDEKRRDEGQPPWLEIQPMIGRSVDAEHLLLYRAVLLGELGYRQGLVLSVPALTNSLADGVLGGGELARHASLDFLAGPGEAPPPVGAGAFLYRHRFAEPFDDLAVRMTLSPLPDLGGAGSIYTMAILLLVAGSGGLFALYRMVAIRVRFAERRSDFVAAVTHELKTPLTAIRMHGEMLRDGMVDSDDKRREYYSTITAESERLTRLIDNVLEFSRLEQGTREMNLRIGCIAPVVDEAARILGPHARELGFSIQVEVDENLPPVRFDRDAVLQVVFNLVDNALKYARASGDRVIALRCRETREGVVLSVRDRGPGVPARHLSQIFEPFYRGEKELTRSAQGAGIGLALVKGLAQRMDAVAVGRNAPEGGFEVSVTFRPLPAA